MNCNNMELHVEGYFGPCIGGKMVRFWLYANSKYSVSVKILW
jgi:hypothetical protein